MQRLKILSLCPSPLSLSLSQIDIYVLGEKKRKERHKLRKPHAGGRGTGFELH